MTEHVLSIIGKNATSSLAARAYELPALVAGAYSRGAALVQVDGDIVDPLPRKACTACASCGGIGYEIRRVAPLELAHCSLCVAPRPVSVPLGLVLPDVWEAEERRSRVWAAVIGVATPMAIGMAILALTAWLRT